MGVSPLQVRRLRILAGCLYNGKACMLRACYLDRRAADRTKAVAGGIPIGPLADPPIVHKSRSHGPTQ